MKLVTYNIQYGRGQDHKYDLFRIIETIRGADVIVLQEVDRHWERDGFDDQTAIISEALPEYFFAYAPNYDMDASIRNDAGVCIQRRRQHGTMILSRVPLITLRNFLLPVEQVLPPNFTMQRGLQEALICWNGRYIRLYNTHLNHMCHEFQRPQIGTIMKIILSTPLDGMTWSGDHPVDKSWIEGGAFPVPEDVILCGDMNLTPDDPGYDLYCGPVSQWYGRVPTQRHLLDTWTITGHEEMEGDSCPDYGRLDYCFVSPSMKEAVSRCHIGSDSNASDHYPLWVEFDL